MTEIFVRKQKIRPGKTERLREWVAEMTDKTEVDKGRVQSIWAEETLYTISLFIEHTDDGDFFVWYLEADSIDQLIEARQNSTHPLHDTEDAMMEDVLEDPEEVGDFEPLIHGTSSERPHEFTVQQFLTDS